MKATLVQHNNIFLKSMYSFPYKLDNVCRITNVKGILFCVVCSEYRQDARVKTLSVFLGGNPCSVVMVHSMV